MGISGIGTTGYNISIQYGRGADSVNMDSRAAQKAEREEKDRLGIEKSPVEKAKMTPAEKDKEHERKKRLGIKDDDETLAEKRANCETCKNRKYQDGSDEMVSFKNASHISPIQAGAAVRAHEQEHVSNAYKKAFEEGGKVLRASVSIHTATCPECGRVYVSGGTTHTCISSPKETPDQAKQAAEAYAQFNGARAV